jgi:hypothetical protein
MDNNQEPSIEMKKTELINASLVFARALGLTLNDKEGVVVDAVGDIVFPDGVKKVIVFKLEDQIHIYKCDEDFEEGTRVNLELDLKQE